MNDENLRSFIKNLYLVSRLSSHNVRDRTNEIDLETFERHVSNISTSEVVDNPSDRHIETTGLNPGIPIRDDSLALPDWPPVPPRASDLYTMVVNNNDPRENLPIDTMFNGIDNVLSEEEDLEWNQLIIENEELETLNVLLYNALEFAFGFDNSNSLELALKNHELFFKLWK